MGDIEESNECSVSTTWVWKRVKIDPPLAAPSKQRRRPLPKPVRALWDSRHPLTILIRYRGGPECWYEIKARGRTHRVTGSTCLHDVMTTIYGQ